MLVYPVPWCSPPTPRLPWWDTRWRRRVTSPMSQTDGHVIVADLFSSHFALPNGRHVVSKRYKVTEGWFVVGKRYEKGKSLHYWCIESPRSSVLLVIFELSVNRASWPHLFTYAPHCLLQPSCYGCWGRLLRSWRIRTCSVPSVWLTVPLSLLVRFLWSTLI